MYIKLDTKQQTNKPANIYLQVARMQATIKYMAKVIDTLQNELKQIKQSMSSNPEENQKSEENKWNIHRKWEHHDVYDTLNSPDPTDYQTLVKERNYYARRFKTAISHKEREHYRSLYISVQKQIHNI